MENPFKNINFRKFVIKLALLLVLGLGTSMLISLFFKYTPLFTNYLDIPQEFSVNILDYKGIFINACLFGIVAFIISGYGKLLKIKDFKFELKQLLFALIALIFLVGTYVLKYLINKNLDYFMQNPQFWGYVKLAFIPLFAISLYLTIFGIPFTKYFLKNFKKEIVTFIALSIGFFILMLLVQNLWTIFSGVISQMLYWLFSLFFTNVTYQPYVMSFTMAEGGGPLLGINGFKAIIGKPCSGIDSFLLFTSLYALIFILDYKRLKKGLTIALFFVGALGMFLTNLVRIFLLFIVGAYIDPKIAVGLFHTNAGWILFIVYFFIYWWIVSRFIYTSKPKKNSSN
jgi:exosortase/archaeosortase family protein